MKNFFIIIKALFSGFFTGFVVSVPLGPAGIESVKRTVSKGYKAGFSVSLGALSADLAYLILINCGLMGILNSNKRTTCFFWIFSGLILTFIGYKSMPNYKNDVHIPFLGNKSFNSIPYLSGFMITFTNPMTPTLWLTLSGTIISYWYYVSKSCYFTFLFSLASGMITWFAMLNYFALKGLKFLTPKAGKATEYILKISILILGIGFIVFGIVKFFI